MSFFVRVCDDKEPAGGTPATGTDGGCYRIVQHVAEVCYEGERAKGERGLVVKVASGSVESLRGQGGD